MRPPLSKKRGGEHIARERVRGSLLQRRSKYMDVDHVRLVKALREILRQQLPPAAARDQLKVEALDLLLSFEAWSRLRREQGLTPKRARETLEAAVRKLLD